MKGTHFQKPLELSILVEGEQWTQGEKITGSFCIKNHSNDKIRLDEYAVVLAYAEQKKIKAKKEDAFKIIEQKTFKSGLEIDPQAEHSLTYQFQLSEDCLIGDKAGATYIIYGNRNSPWQSGILELPILEKPTITLFLKLFETFLRFKIKEKKSKKDFIEVKLIPPESREFATIESLTIVLKEVQKQLHISYIFKAKKLSYSLEGVGVESKDLKFSKEYNAKEYEFSPGAINQDLLLKDIKEIIEQVKTKTMV